MMASRGMGAIAPSKMPKGTTKARRDNTDFTEYKKGGWIEDLTQNQCDEAGLCKGFCETSPSNLCVSGWDCEKQLGYPDICVGGATIGAPCLESGDKGLACDEGAGESCDSGSTMNQLSRPLVMRASTASAAERRMRSDTPRLSVMVTLARPGPVARSVNGFGAGFRPVATSSKIPGGSMAIAVRLALVQSS